MIGLEMVVVLGATVLLVSSVAHRVRVAPPILLLGGGALLGFVPALRAAHLPPQVVLLLFLPALLYWESLTTSLREIRSNLRGIVLLSTALVVATAAAVAVTVHTLGLAWGPAWVLGAAVAPTDATATAAFARGLPRSTTTVLRAESLANDGTALVVYALAVGVTTGETPLTVGHVSWLVILSYGGGAAAGVAVAWVATRLRRHIDDALRENVVTVLTPFTAFLLAETIGASGVIAVVGCGLIMSQTEPRVGRADTREQTKAFWSLSTYLLNGALFVLVGVELQSAVRGLTSVALTRGLLDVAVVSAVLIAVRVVFLFATAYTIRLVDRRPQQRLRRISHRARLVTGAAGFRGAVSLAAALAVPATVSGGAAFPARDTLVFVTAGVIAVTLVAQGVALPAVVRWAHLAPDTAVARERREAQTVALQGALGSLPEVAARLGTSAPVLERTRREFEEHLHVLTVHPDGDVVDPAVQESREYTALRVALVTGQRRTVLALRDQGHIDDIVLGQLQDRLDIEEIRLNRDRADD